MKIINNNLLVNEEKSRIIVIGDLNAAVLSCAAHELEECTQILQSLIGTIGIVSMDADDICSLNHPGKTIRPVSAFAKGETCVQDVCRNALADIEPVHDICILLTVPSTTDLDAIEEGISTLATKHIHPDGSIIWSVDFTEEDHASFQAIIF